MKKRSNNIARPMRAPARPHRPLLRHVDLLRPERKMRLVRSAAVEMGRVGIGSGVCKVGDRSYCND